MDKADELRPEEYEIKDLIANGRFIKSVNALRDRWDIPREGFGTNKAENLWREQNEDKIGDFAANIETLRENFDLTLRWQTALRFFILTNNPLMLRAQSPWELRFTYEGTINDHKNVRQFSSVLDERITQEEVLSAQKTTRRLANKPKKQLITNVDRDNRVYKLYQEGKSHIQIADWLNENYRGQTFTTDNVAKIIKRVSVRHTKRNTSQD